MRSIIKNCSVHGIHFVTDENGKKIAVQISLEEWRALREDIGDVSVSASRQGEPAVSWEDLKAELDRETYYAPEHR